jgi:hypothetical protein
MLIARSRSSQFDGGIAVTMRDNAVNNRLLFDDLGTFFAPSGYL